MTEKTGKERFVLLFLLSVAVIAALYDLFLKYHGSVLFSFVKALVLLATIIIYGYSILFLLSRKKNETSDDACKSVNGEEKITPNPNQHLIICTHRPLFKISEIPCATAIGLIFTTFFFYAVCFLKILTPVVIFSFFGVGAILVLVILKFYRFEFIETLRSFFMRPPLEYALFFIPFVFASLPSSFYDSLVYHLGIPNLYLQHGGFIPTPQFLFANTSIYYEISLIPAVFSGDMVPRFFHFMIGIIFILAAVYFAVEFFELKKRWLVLLLLVSMPMSVFLLSTEKNDLIGAFFLFLGCRTLFKKQYVLSGLFLGFSAGVKYFNVLPAAVFLLFFLFRAKPFPFKKIILAGFISAAVFVPLLIKNFVYTGNPFFPFLTQYFQSPYWDMERYYVMAADVGKMFHSLLDFMKAPYTISFQSFGFGGISGAQFLIFLPFLLIPHVREALKKKWFLLFVSLVILGAGGFFTGSSRFMFIAFVFLSFYVAYVYEYVGQKLLKYLVMFVICFNVVTGISMLEQLNRSHPLLLGRQTVEQYKEAMFPTYPAIDYVNKNSVPGSRVILEGEARNFYLKRPYFVASGNDYAILKKYLEDAENSENVFQRLTRDQISYIIFNLSEFNRLQKMYRRLNEQEWSLWVICLKQLQSRIVFEKNGVFVFRVSGPGNPGN